MQVAPGRGKLGARSPGPLLSHQWQRQGNGNAAFLRCLFYSSFLCKFTQVRHSSSLEFDLLKLNHWTWAAALARYGSALKRPANVGGPFQCAKDTDSFSITAKIKWQLCFACHFARCKILYSQCYHGNSENFQFYILFTWHAKYFGHSCVLDLHSTVPPPFFVECVNS